MPSAAFTRIATTGRTTALYLRGGFLRVIGAAPVLPEPLPPTLGDVSPAPGSPLEKLQPITLRVTDIDGDLRRVVLLASFRGLDEWAFDGAGFSSQYAGSSVTGVTGGLEFVLRRLGGWPSGPTLRVRAYDAAGSEL